MKSGGLTEIKKEWHGSLKSYLIGFVISLLLTAISFSLVMQNILSGNELMYVLITLALLQAIGQSLFFLHVGKESKPFWETSAYLFMVLVVVIIVLGSLWIMYDLDYRVMAGMTHD